MALIESNKKDYQLQLSKLTSENESKYLKSNEDITDKMQHEIESIQLKWQQEKQNLLEKHQKASELLSDKLTATESQLDNMTNQYNHSNDELRTLKIAYEKMIQVKDKEIKEAAEEKTDDIRVQSIVFQHQKEINVLQTQFQQLLDLKDKELESFSYRLKTVTTSQHKDLEKLTHDYQQKLAVLDAECQRKEENLNSKTLELRWSTAEFESSETKLKDQGAKLQKLENENQHLHQKVQQCQEENAQMLR
ncbi:hypothetical protein BD408DRAFT_453794 [Parasitella parasitica]|nr:hypothetical protein BD408DRAFT_453794 [Parasitella parasitica]